MHGRFTLMLAAAALAAAGCSPGPMSKPGRPAPPMNSPRPLDTDAPTGSVESVRRQFFGTWDLVALESVPERGGSRVPIKASGTLVYDEFGNLTIEAHSTDANAPVAAREANLLTFHGRAVIDATNKELKLMAMTGNVDPNEVLSVDRRRRYEFTNNNDQLKLSSFDAGGTVTAISTWKRRQQ
jgi:hypothetical protein